MNGNFKEAKECFQKVLDTNPNNFDALVGIAAAELRLNNTKSAIEYAKKAVKIKDDSFEAWYVLMGAYMADENWNGAYVSADRAYMYAPNDKKEELKNIQLFLLKKMG
jgi:tetratricopeptide (TPR) repeat protein